MKSSTMYFLTILLSLLISNISVAQDLKVSSWNIAWLSSHEYNKRTNDDYEQLASYAKTLNADVISLQEVESEQWARKVFGDDYDYYFSTKDWVQRVGVAIKKSAKLEVEAIEYKALDVGRVRHGMDITISRNGAILKLLAVHLKSGCFEAPLDKKSVAAMPATNEREQKRKHACSTLSKQVTPLEEWVDEQARRDIPFLIVGDFNRRFAKDIEAKYSENEGLWQALDDEGNESLWTPTTTVNSKCWGGYYKDYIDHIIFNPSAKKLYQKNSFSQLVFTPEYTRKLSQTLSDHCPISVTLSF
ncbi:MAG: endonuclease/exonuclease/phosphatase family protein [Colwellia sp.]